MPRLEGVKFPPYQFRPYPKTIYPKGVDEKDEHGHPKFSVTVYNEAQERAIMEGIAIDIKVPEAGVLRDEDGDVDDTGNPEDSDEHTLLMKEAVGLGISADGSWSTKKLKKMIRNVRLTEKV